MKQRNLNDILREVYQTGVTDQETIEAYIRGLGNRTLYSLAYDERRSDAEKEWREEQAVLELVPASYDAFKDCSREELDSFMKQVTLKEFMCLSKYLLTDTNIMIADLDPKDGAEPKAVASCILNLLFRAKRRDDEDVINFCKISFDSLCQYTSHGEDDGSRSKTVMGDLLYKAQDVIKWKDSENRTEFFEIALGLLCNCMARAYGSAAFEKIYNHYQYME